MYTDVISLCDEAIPNTVDLMPHSTSRPHEPTNGAKIRVSVGILTYDSSIETVEATIRSAVEFDDIIVCDARSTDGTRELAKKFGCRVIDQDAKFNDANGRLINEAGVNRQLLDAARYDWLLLLDHDELLTPELVDEIGGVIESVRTAGAFQIPRLYVLNGVVIRCAAMYPRYQTRLLYTHAVEGFSGVVHSPVILRTGEAVVTMEHPMLIPLPGQREQWRKWRGYLRLEEIEKARLTRSEWVTRVLRPQWRTAKWIVYRIIKTRRTCGGARLPLHHEFGRVIYELAVIAYTGRRFLGLGNSDVAKAWR